MQRALYCLNQPSFLRRAEASSPTGRPLAITCSSSGRADHRFARRLSGPWPLRERGYFKLTFRYGPARRISIEWIRLNETPLLLCPALPCLVRARCPLYRRLRDPADVAAVADARRDQRGARPEITCKAARAGWRIYEVPISYSGRTYDKGKKIGWRDALAGIISYRLAD